MHKILIIDDDRMFASDLKDIIEMEDHNRQCTIWTRVEEVLDHWEELSEYRTILLDLMMQRKWDMQVTEEEEVLDTGEILFRRIRSAHPQMRVLLLTGKNCVDISLRWQEDANMEILAKPLNESRIRYLLSTL